MDLNTMLQALGREVALVRKARGLTQAELAERAGVTSRQMGKIERGEAGQIGEAWVVAQALGVDFSTLVAEAEQQARRLG